MTAGMKRRFEDRLQDLGHRLLNHPIHHVRHGCFELHIGPVSGPRTAPWRPGIFDGCREVWLICSCEYKG
jgi:hypothetical protein